jgi:hypothetical protein
LVWSPLGAGCDIIPARACAALPSTFSLIG